MTARAQHQVQSRRWLAVAFGLLSITLTDVHGTVVKQALI